ncbi:MAG TPA: thiolase family protein [Solirubrobacterales bacterium]|nr:thiolase family protein [Solirubrobacterales bacterium]
MSIAGREAVIAGAVRTPVGRGHPEKGIYADLHPADLLGRTLVALLDRCGLDSTAVDNLIVGCAYQIAEQSSGIARTSWLAKGLAEGTGAMTVDVRCGSGEEAADIAALRIATGVDEVLVAAGVEHMGRVGFPVNQGAQEEWGRAFPGELLERYDLVPQGVGAEMIAAEYGITRADMDEFAVRSHRLAQAATEDGSFAREILPIESGGTTHTTDQGIRPGSTVEKLAALKPAFSAEGSVTAGNSSQISDGAAALLLSDREQASRLGLTPRAVMVDQVVLGVDPVTMLKGPIPATARILERNGLKIDDIDVVEINEAFASVPLAWIAAHGADPARVNPRGGAIALGHPLGSTGARLLTTLLHELEDLDVELGLVTMCCGGGIGTATLIRRL